MDMLNLKMLELFGLYINSCGENKFEEILNIC